MIKKIYAILTASAFLLIGGLVSTANAQVSSDTIVRAKIPFSFVVRNKIFPAGEYTIKPTDDESDSDTVLQIMSDKGQKKDMVFETFVATENQAPREDTLVFDKYGDKYFLSKIFAANETSGNELEKSKMEKSMESGKVKKETYKLKVKFWEKGDKMKKQN